MPPPMPNTANATASGTVAEVTVSRDSSTPPAASPRPAVSMGSRARLSSGSGITRFDLPGRNCVSTTNYLGDG